MAVSVNGLCLSANYTQNEARSTREKTDPGIGFEGYLKKSLSLGEMIHDRKENVAPVKLQRNRRSMNIAKTVPGNVRANSAAMKDNPKRLEELSASDAVHDRKRPKNALYLIDEVIAALQKLGVLLESAEPAGENAAGIAFSDEIESVISQSVSMLLEIAGCTDGKVSELAGELAMKLNQMLENGLPGVIPGELISESTAGFSELVGRMLREAESIKSELGLENAGEGIEPETFAGNESPDEIGTQDLQQKETGGTGQNGRQRLRAEDRPKDDGKGSTTADEMVSVLGRRNIGNANLRGDIDRFMQDYTVESTQAGGTDYSGPVRTAIIAKTDILAQVAEKVRVLAGSDRSEMIIQLKPESLGRIQLQVIHERGEIVAKFLAENEQVKAILESNMQYLRDSLEQSGVDIQSLSVSVGQHGHSDDTESYESRFMQSRPQGLYIEDLPEADGISSTYSYTGLEGDLYSFMGTEINLIA